MNRLQNWYKKNIPNLEGRVIIITGANSGLGKETARVLAQNNATIIMACRSTERGEAAVAEIKKQNPRADLIMMELDLADLNSIEEFSKSVKKEVRKIDVLINNAGVMALTPRQETNDGFEMQIGVNHLGHFALTGKLIDTIYNTENARIVNVSSSLHRLGTFNWDDLMWEESYNRWKAYSRSKLANILFTIKLQQKLQEFDKDTLVLASHPGYSDTNLQYQAGNSSESTFFKTISNKLFVPAINKILAQNAEMGALGTIQAAVSEHVEPGGYYGPKNNGMRGFPVINKYDPKIVKQEDADKLWDVSEKLTNITYSF